MKAVGLVQPNDVRAELSRKICYLPLPDKLKTAFGRYESRYHSFETGLRSEDKDMDKLYALLLGFRLHKAIFYHELLEFAKQHPGLVTSLDDISPFSELVVDARLTLFEHFPAHTNSLECIASVPVAFLPFIKLSEDPISSAFGYTMKFGGPPLVIIQTGTGREFATIAHEHLHAVVNGLPHIFEEGFCRYSLYRAGIAETDLGTIFTQEANATRMNFSGVYYPILLVALLSQGFGDPIVEQAFFGCNVSELEKRTRQTIGKTFKEIDDAAHFIENGARILLALKRTVESSLSDEIKIAVDRVSGVILA